jgi:hypothetical protein
MKSVACLVVTGLLFVATTGMAAGPSNAAADAYAAVFAAKKVPAADKNSVDVVGRVVGGAGVTLCGVPVLTIRLQVGGQAVFGQCAGASMYSTCGHFSLGQRVHLQGVLAQVPDVTTPGFDPCDPSTWQLLLPGVGTFVATKSVK